MHEIFLDAGIRIHKAISGLKGADEAGMAPQRGCCMAHLDDFAAGFLQGSNLLAKGQRQLVGLGLPGDVLTGEGPVQDRHRTCKHQALIKE